MTASPQPQREYIITEEQLHEIYQQTRDRIGYSCCEDTVRDVRTRPHTPAPEPTMVFPHCIHGVFDESELRTHCLKDSGTCLDWRKCEGRIPRQIPTQKEYIDAFCKFQQDKRDKHDAAIARTATLSAYEELGKMLREKEKYCNDKGDADENFITSGGWYARAFQCVEMLGIIEYLRQSTTAQQQEARR
jgi:hypothetical protein